MDSTTSVDRPTIDDLRTMSYNRVTIPSDLKNTICSQIADSSESLPLWSQNKYDGAHDQPPSQNVPDSSHIETPRLEKSNPMDAIPLDQQKTAQADDLDQHSQRSGIPAGGNGGGVGGTAKDDRPGTLRRLTTKIKKTMSGGNLGADHGKKTAAQRAQRS